MSEPKVKENLDKSIVEYYTERDLRKKYNQQLLSEHNVERSKISKKSTKPYLIAASIAFFLLVGFLVHIQMNSAGQLTKEYIASTNVLGNQDVSRKDVSLVEKLRQEANQAFTNKNYEKSIERYELLLSSGNVAAIDKFYLAIAYLRMDRPEKALTLLEPLKNETAHSQEVEWFLALTHIVLKENNLAKPYLKKIIDNKQYMHREALKLLNKVK